MTNRIYADPYPSQGFFVTPSSPFHHRLPWHFPNGSFIFRALSSKSLPKAVDRGARGGYTRPVPAPGGPAPWRFRKEEP